MTRKRQQTMVLGDPFPLVPSSHFVRDSIDLKEAWQLVGPTMYENRKRNAQDLQCIAFLEGMRMAYAVLRESKGQVIHEVPVDQVVDLRLLG
jgi:hypothetical protein